jgi:hypothetical protein
MFRPRLLLHSLNPIEFHFRLQIEGILEDKKEIPAPSKLDGLINDDAIKGSVAFLVNVDMADKVERFNITARKSQMEEIDRLAKKRGMTRSPLSIGFPPLPGFRIGLFS